MRHCGVWHVPLTSAAERSAAKNIRWACVHEKLVCSESRRAAMLTDMRSALGSVSGSKAPLTTVHAKLEATVLRARRHQGSGSCTADARAGAESLRNAAAGFALGTLRWCTGGRGRGKTAGSAQEAARGCGMCAGWRWGGRDGGGLTEGSRRSAGLR